MSQHMVIFQNPDGDPGYNQFESIDDAVGFVEKLRNEQGIDSIRIFELEEVKFDLKPVYKVELQALNPGSSTPSAPAPSAPQPSPAPPQSAPTSPPPSAPPAPPEPAQSAEPPSGSPFAPPSEPAAAEPAPAPPADQPSEDGQPARRGLFGR